MRTHVGGVENPLVSHKLPDMGQHDQGPAVDWETRIAIGAGIVTLALFGFFRFEWLDGLIAAVGVGGAARCVLDKKVLAASLPLSLAGGMLADRLGYLYTNNKSLGCIVLFIIGAAMIYHGVRLRRSCTQRAMDDVERELN